MKKKKVLIQLSILVLVVGVVLTGVLRLQASQGDAKQRTASRDLALAASNIISFPRFDASSQSSSIFGKDKDHVSRSPSRYHKIQTGLTTSPSPTLTASPSPTPTATNPSGMLHVQGTQLVDASGHPVLLRGAQIESPFAGMKAWQRGKSISKNLNSAVFSAMANDWKMNVVRLPISNWIYALDPTTYLSQLDQVVQEANTAGLYVVLDLHDNAKSGSPYGDTAGLPKAESVAFWKAIASHYKDNSMVLFDVFNEPQAKDWQTWLHGGGTVGGAQVVGFQDLVDAIRSVGAQQIIVVEPGSAGGNRRADAGWATVGSNTINDANIMYSLHVYNGITSSPSQQDAKWGPILNHYPIYYGEWALLPNAYNPAHCRSISPNLADQYVTNFLNYMSSRQANWTAWEFTPHHLIQSATNFAPTTLDIPWTCGDTTSPAGMGTLVKQFLANG